MTLRNVVFLVALLAPFTATAQMRGASVELFGTAGAVGGFTPVKAASGSHVDPHAGLRFDGGFQFARLALGLGGRYWEMLPTDEYGGSGLDAFLVGEWRVDYSLRTTVRATFGTGFRDFDSGHGPDRPTISADGVVWSAGIAHEVIAPSGARVVLSLDMLVPQATPGPIGLRRPVFELGVGYRFRFLQPILPLPR
jgi:hypothetical protein